jgi:hypothetical protein
MHWDSETEYRQTEAGVQKRLEAQAQVIKTDNSPYGQRNSPCCRIALLIPLAARSKTCVCGRSISGIASSNPSQGMDVHILCLLHVVYVAASATS